MSKKEEKKKDLKEEDIKNKDEPILDEKDILIESLKQEIFDLKNKYALAYADTENFKKHLKKEHDDLIKYRAQGFLESILPSLDNLERAIESCSNKEDQFYIGVKMIYDQIVEAMKKEGVEEIKCLNEEFDPKFEQAMMQESVDGVKPNVVTEVLQKGYKIKDRVLRVATVKVSK